MKLNKKLFLLSIISFSTIALSLNSHIYTIYPELPNSDPFKYASAPSYEEVFGTAEPKYNSHNKNYLFKSKNIASILKNFAINNPKATILSGIFTGAFSLRYAYNYNLAKKEYKKSLKKEKISYFKKLINNSLILAKVTAKTSYEALDTSTRLYLYLNLRLKIKKLKQELELPHYNAKYALIKLRELKELEKTSTEILANAMILK